MNKKRPTAITVLAVLSLISIGYQLIVVVLNLASGPMTDAEIKEQKLAILRGADEEMIKESSFAIEQLIDVLEITRDNLYAISSANLLVALVGLIAVLLMMRLRKLGFHLYIVYSLLPVLVSTYFFGEISFGVIGIIVSAVLSVIFVILYAFQLKHME